MFYVDFIKGYMCCALRQSANRGILKSKSPNAQDRTPMSLITLQAIITLSGKTVPIWKAKRSGEMCW